MCFNVYAPITESVRFYYKCRKKIDPSSRTHVQYPITPTGAPVFPPTQKQAVWAAFVGRVGQPSAVVGKTRQTAGKRAEDRKRTPCTGMRFSHDIDTFSVDLRAARVGELDECSVLLLDPFDVLLVVIRQVGFDIGLHSLVGKLFRTPHDGAVYRV